MDLISLRAALMGVSAYCELKEQPALVQVRALLDALHARQGERAMECYAQLFHTLRREGFQGLGDWLWDALRYTEGPYARLAERGGTDPALENSARRDVETFVLLAETDCDAYVDAMKALLPAEYGPALAGLPRWRAAAPFLFDALTRCYQAHGAGLFARYRASWSRWPTRTAPGRRSCWAMRCSGVRWRRTPA